MTTTLPINDILDEATLPEAPVPLCLNGRLRREYAQVQERIAERREEATRAILANNVAEVADDRLAAKTAVAEAGALDRDPEQDLADTLLEKIKAQTIEFVLAAVDPDDWQELVGKHPPRKDPTTGRVLQADAVDMVNVATFYPELVKRSIIKPAFSPEQYTRARKKMSTGQFNKLAKAAAEVNVQDDDIPF